MPLSLSQVIMNVAAIAITLPVSLVIAKYLGVAPMSSSSPPWPPRACPSTCSSAAAPNAIAYESKQLSAGDFFIYGWIPSFILIAFLAGFC